MKCKESEIIELKKSTAELKEAVVSVASILNKHRAGSIFFGIKNDGTVVGQTVSEQTLREIARALSEHIEPRIYPQVEKVRLNGKDCVEIRFSGNDAPYLAYGRAYIRIADEDRQLSARELEKMFLNRAKGDSRWEAEFSDKTISDVDVAAVRQLVKKGRSVGRIDFGFVSVKGVLNKLKLLRNGRLLKAGEVLFCADNPLQVQTAVFAGRDKSTFLDIKKFTGTIFDLLDKTETYVNEHIDWRVKFGKLEREEIPEVPAAALREALVNSLCHRDYRILKGNEVAIFKDRIEIYNPGDFPEGYTPEDFIRGEEHSITRNPLIADVLFRSKDVEEWGSGLKRIVKDCTESGVKVEFKILKSGFLTTFYRNPAKDFLPRTGEKTREKTREKILGLIKRYPNITTSELAEQTALSVKGIEWNIRILKKQGLIKRVGPDKGGHWEVLK